MSQVYKIIYLWGEKYENRRRTKQYIIRSEPVGNKYPMNAKRQLVTSPARREMADNRNSQKWQIYCTNKQRIAQGPYRAYCVIYRNIYNTIAKFYNVT